MTYLTHADLGGASGHGPVLPEPEGELWHAAWEPRVFSITLAMGATGAWNLDMSRAARETLPNYAELSYYEIWFAGLQRLLAERGLARPDEMAAGRALHPPLAVKRVLRSADVGVALATGSPTLRTSALAPRFDVGQQVRTRSAPVPHHSRLPGYARSKLGVVERRHGVHVFADDHAQGRGEMAQWLYTVAFDGAEVWGKDAAPGLTVSIDAWEAYLEPV
jgi:nitrile hydratase